MEASFAGDSCGTDQYYKYDPVLINNEFSTFLPEESLLVCADCSDLMPGCDTCTSATSCTTCAADAFQVTMASGDSECFYNFCGFSGARVNYDTTACDTCSISNCEQCIYNTAIETCNLCEVGYYLKSDGSECTLIANSASVDLYVLSYEGYEMTSAEITAM